MCIDDLCIDDLPATYDGIAKTIWSILCGLVKQVDFVCDVYYSPSIKDHEIEKTWCNGSGYQDNRSRSEKN